MRTVMGDPRALGIVLVLLCTPLAVCQAEDRTGDCCRYQSACCQPQPTLCEPKQTGSIGTVPVVPVSSTTTLVGNYACPYKLSKNYGSGYSLYFMSNCVGGAETATDGLYVLRTTSHLHRCPSSTWPGGHSPTNCACFPTKTTLRSVCIGGLPIQQIYLDPELEKGFDKFPEDTGEYDGVRRLIDPVVVRFKKGTENEARHFVRLNLFAWKHEGKTAGLQGIGWETPQPDVREDLKDQPQLPEAEVMPGGRGAYYILKYDQQLYHVFTQKP